MSIVREIIARFGVDVDANDLNRLDGTLGTVVGGVQRLAQAFAGWQVTQQLMAFTNEMVAAGGAISTTAGQLSIGTTELQELQHAAMMSNASAEALGAGLRSLNTRAFNATTGNTALAATFRHLGVQLKDSDGNLRSTDALFTDLADGISGVESPTERSAIAMRLFGGAGAELAPLLARGSAGVAELRAEFHLLGGGMSSETVEAAAALGDEFNRLDAVQNAFRGRLAIYVLPLVSRFTESLISLSSAMLRAAEGSHVMEAALSALAGVATFFAVRFLVPFAPMIGIFAAVAVAITFIVLLVDDLIVMFEGGTSVIGGFLDELFGLGTSQQVVTDLTDAWDGFFLTIRDTIDAVKEFLGLPVEDRPVPGVSTGDTSPEGLARARAARGEVVSRPGTRGGTFEDALAYTNSVRAESNMPALDSSGNPTGRARGRTANMRARGGGGSVDARADVSITVQGNLDRQTADSLSAQLDETLARRNRQAAETLGVAVDD